MRRIKIVFSYDGSDFSGYQKQPNKRTVQSAIEYVLRKIDVKPIIIVASGRTDAKVHAIGQVAHFDVMRDSIKVHHLQHIFNRQLPPDIIVTHVEEVDSDFHARFDVTGKEYWYKFRTSKEQLKSPFTNRYITYVQDEIDVEKLNAIGKLYLGEHDFASFTTAPSHYNSVREIQAFNCEYDESEQCYIVKIRGTGFLQYMIRILVAYMFEIYRGREKRESIAWLYETKDKKYVHAKMEPNGLYLMEVYYANKSKKIIET